MSARMEMIISPPALQTTSLQEEGITGKERPEAGLAGTAQRNPLVIPGAMMGTNQIRAIAGKLAMG